MKKFSDDWFLNKYIQYKNMVCTEYKKNQRINSLIYLAKEKGVSNRVLKCLKLVSYTN